MKFIFLFFTFCLGGLLRQKASELMPNRASLRPKRDLIGYNRQRNTAHQLTSSRFKVQNKNHLERYNRKIAEYITKNEKIALKRLRRRLLAIEKQRRANILKKLGYQDRNRSTIPGSAFSRNADRFLFTATAYVQFFYLLSVINTAHQSATPIHFKISITAALRHPYMVQ